MVFYLKVMGGADDGTSHRVESGDVVIGRAPTAKIQLRDESVAWEHAVVRDAGARLVVNNLAAAGIKVRGKRVTEESRVAAGDEIVLSHKVKVIVESRTGAGGTGGSSRTTLMLVLAVVLLLVGLGAVMLLTRDGGIFKPPMSERHWRQGYVRLAERAETWVDQNRFPKEAVVFFHDAWRLENANNLKAAAEKWRTLQNVLRSLPTPSSNGGVSAIRFPENSQAEPTALGIVMGWDTWTGTSEINWDSDEAFADALMWFVRKRAETLQNKLKE
jgi:pSer/pThr/pTyr-binding forkhead associated (FHA) protein